LPAHVQNPVLPSLRPTEFGRLFVGAVRPVIAEFRGFDLDLDQAQAAAGCELAIGLAQLPIISQPNAAFSRLARVSILRLDHPFFSYLNLPAAL